MKEKSLLIAAFFSALGSTMYFIVVSWLIYEMTSDATYTGLMVGFGFLPGVFLNLVFGIWVDRVNRKKLTVLSNIIVTASVVFLFISMKMNLAHPWILIAVHMSVQTFSSLFRTAQQAFVTEVFDKKDIPRVFSNLGSATSIGGLIGTSFGGFAMSFFSSSNAILIICFTFIITMLCLMKIDYRPSVTEGMKNKGLQAIFHDLLEGFRYVHQKPFMYALLTMMFVGQLVVHTTAGMLSVYTSSHLKGDGTLYGILESATSIGAIIAGLTATFYLNKSKTFVPIGAFLLTAFGLLGMALSKNSVLAFIFIFLIGLATTWLRVLMQSVQQVATDPEFYGRMAATRQTVNQTSVAIGGPILGWIADQAGVQYSYGALLIPVIILLIYSMFFSKDANLKAIIHSIIPDDSGKHDKSA